MKNTLKVNNSKMRQRINFQHYTLSEKLIKKKNESRLSHMCYAVPRFLSYSHPRERQKEDPGKEFDMLCCVCDVDVIAVYLIVLLSLRS